MDILVEFMYRGKVALPRNQLHKLYRAARTLEVPGLVDTLSKYLMTEEKQNRQPEVSRSQGARKRKGRPMKMQPKGELCGTPSANGTSGRREDLPFSRSDLDEEASGADEDSNVPLECAEVRLCDWPGTSQAMEATDGGKKRPHPGAFRLRVDDSFACGRCVFRTQRRTSWVQHLAEQHRVDPEGNALQPDVRCPDCDYVCVTKERLRLHRRAKHARGECHKCPACDYSSIRKCDLERHLKCVHGDERPHVCDLCGHRSKTVSALNNHLRAHAGYKPYRCHLCGKTFAQGPRLRNHLQEHSNAVKPYVCHLCGHACRRRDNLLVHLRRMHKEEDAAAVQ